ncbi:MAG TPA: hypothetical protein VFX06_04805 [Stellaceae bacterium]|nr:hypothetical protein [Stellaceae bacterium]
MAGLAIGEAEERMADTTPTRSDNERAGAPASSHETPQPRELGERALNEVKELGSDLFSAARESSATLIGDQRERAAREVNAVSGVLRSTVRPLEDAGVGPLARYAESAARQIDEFAERVRHSSWQELSQDIEHFARTWPVAYLATGMGIGFVAGRVLVSALPRGGSHATAAARPHGETHTELYRAPGSGAIGTPVGLGAAGARETR